MATINHKIELEEGEKIIWECLGFTAIAKKREEHLDYVIEICDQDEINRVDVCSVTYLLLHEHAEKAFKDQE